MKVIVCGGRDFREKTWLFDFLDQFHAENNITLLIEGDAGRLDRQGRVIAGADKFAGQWAVSRRIKHKKVPADWDKYKKAAGWIRNNAMADLNPDVVIPFPGGRGTKMMVDIADKRKIRVVRPDPTNKPDGW